MKLSKKSIMYIVCSVLIIVASIVFGFVSRREKTLPQDTEKVSESQKSTEKEETETTLTDIPGTEATTQKKATEKTEEKEIIKYNLKEVNSFLPKEKVKELKEQLEKLMSKKVTSVRALDYQKSSAEDMNITFYLKDSTKKIYEVIYNFPFSTLEVKKETLTEEELKKQSESEKKAFEESEQAASESAKKEQWEKERQQYEEQKKVAEKTTE